MSLFVQLPDELALKVILECELYEVIQISKSCKKFNLLINNAVNLWATLKNRSIYLLIKDLGYHLKTIEGKRTIFYTQILAETVGALNENTLCSKKVCKAVSIILKSDKYRKLNDIS